MSKILITGTNGLLGQHLVRLFRKDNSWEIVATARGENRLGEAGHYTFRSMDICDENAVNAVFEEIKPDYVIHGAAMTQVDSCEQEKACCWETNVTATQYLINAARKHKSFFTFISTDFIFDGASGPYNEEALPNPVDYYGLSKLAAEMLLQGSGIEFAILRTILVYGVAADAGKSNIVLWIKESLEAGKNIKVVDDQWRTPTLIQDLAEGCKLAVEKKRSGKKDYLQEVYNISGRELLTPYEMALRIADFFKLDPDLITRADATTFSQVAKRPARTGFILDKAERELGYAPHSFEEGLAVVRKELTRQ